MAERTTTGDAVRGRASREPAYKRPLDVAIVITAYAVLAPLWALIWILVPLAVWLEDRGPIFFKQKRFGLNGRIFNLLKFRSMVRNADKIGPEWTGHRDARVTKVGRFLRRTGLDEVPQAINIVRGDIGLVGPRALPIRMHEEATKQEPRFPLRLQVRPGGTGLALLHAPRHCSPRKRLRYDLLYIENASFWLDIRILVLTTWLALTGRWGTGFRRPEEEGTGT